MKPPIHSRPPARRERGFLLIEALVALLIFSLGILGMIAMGSTAIGAQSDAQYRTDAAALADDIVNTISLNVDRSTPAALAASLGAFQHQPGGTDCAFTGSASTNLDVVAWLGEVTTTGAGKHGLPGTVSSGEQIVIDTSSGNYNRVQVSVCWRAPGTAAGVPMRRHTVVAYVN